MSQRALDETEVLSATPDASCAERGCADSAADIAGDLRLQAGIAVTLQESQLQLFSQWSTFSALLSRLAVRLVNGVEEAANTLEALTLGLEFMGP